ncbi:MAG TPA: chorismate mutase, partial [Nitrosopumilaceae archaeon]|nr:chorismate mutase [Nitrosopumilaceae archaeon]
MSEIDKLRDQMDKITLEMIKLLKDRAEISKQIGSLKSNLGLGITNEERESQLRTKVISLCKEIGLDEKIATMLLNFLLNESIKIQSTNKQTHLSIFLKARSLEQQGK